MALIINSAELPTLDPEQTHWCYNALDCCVTHEVGLAQDPQVTKNADLIYTFERAMQAPALEMMTRGVRIDSALKTTMILEFEAKKKLLQANLNRMSNAVWEQDLNPNSPKQLKDFLYSIMGLPVQTKRGANGKYGPSTDRNALENLRPHFMSRPIISTILALRDHTKLLSVLRSGVDKDGRIRASYNVAGTETGRWSSSANAFGTGTNLQNITEKLRTIFVADPGMKFAYIDLEQAESRAVAGIIYQLFGETEYLDACESGDLHTTVCRMVWTGLPWTGELYHDKKSIAGQTFYRDFTYRDMAKRGGHGTNYYGTPYTMARHLKVETEVMQRFQRSYFDAFPGIRKWHHEVARQLQIHGHLTTLLGRKRFFFGRRNDDATLREAIAYNPQSTVGDILNLGAWRVWKADCVQMLGQIHDAILIQYPEKDEDKIIPQVLDLITVPIPLGDRELIIPSEAQVGWNWNHKSENNPDGLSEFTGHDERTRTRSANTSLLDTVLP